MVSQCFACPFLTSFLSKNWSSGYQQLGSFVPSLSLEPIDEVCSCSRKVWKSRGKVAEKCQSESGNDFEHVLNMLNKYPKLKRGIDVSYVECAPAKAYYDILWVNWLDVTPVHVAGTPKLKTSASAYHRTHINIYKYLYNNIYTYIYIIWYIYIISYIYIIYISYIYISYIYMYPNDPNVWSHAQPATWLSRGRSQIPLQDNCSKMFYGKSTRHGMKRI